MLLAAARNVLVQGISYGEFCEILKAQGANDAGMFKTSRGRVGLVSVRIGLLLGLVGLSLAAAAVAIALLLPSIPEAWSLGFLSLGVSGFILALRAVVWAVSDLMGSRVAPATQYGVWLGPYGRRFFGLAGIGLGRVGVAERPSIRRPETLLSHAVRSALADLGGLEQREATLAVIAELEAEIGVLRAERDAIDLELDRRDHVTATPPGSARVVVERPIGEARIGVDDARLAVNRQIEKAIATFEAIRLDLLRIRSGVGSHDDLKSDLEMARRIAVPGPNRARLSAGIPTTG
jgi:hypothetical protein